MYQLRRRPTDRRSAGWQTSRPTSRPRHRVRLHRMRMGRFVTEAHTLAALGILERPFCASTCGFVMVVCQGTSWHLGANRHPKSACGGFLLARPPSSSMQRWHQFQNTALVPAFRELRARDIYASTQKLCCQSCARARSSLPGPLFPYPFFHSQDRCIETPASQLTCTPRFVAPEERSYKGFCRIPTRI